MYTKGGTIDRIEGNTAVILTEDNQTLHWEVDNLPHTLTEGSAVILEIKDKRDAQKDKQELAEHILKEIFAREPV